MPTGGDQRRRELLLRMFDAAVAAAHPAKCLPPHLPPVPGDGHLIIIGAGKAGAAMAVAAGEHYARSSDAARVFGSVVTRHGFALPPSIIEITEAGHPVPDDASVAAARRALALASDAGEQDLVLCLLSGGASALWSAPVDGVSLAAKQALTRALLKAGARISEINMVRRHISAIKGGRLAAAAFPAQLVTLAISDVPGDDPAVIGSGPTVADASTLADARQVLVRFSITPPPEIAAALADPANETVKPGSIALSATRYELIATPRGSIEAGAAIARAAGYEVEVLGDALEGEARDVAARHATMALAAKARGRRVAILSGGELTVTVTGTGAGGPNQEYALGFVAALAGAAGAGVGGISALAADTDGIDGGGGSASDPAGAIVVEDSLARAAARQLNPATFLANNASTAFFEQLGDLVRSGPTQTNVNDFRAILIDPDDV
jgi:glycerate 2-kinase